MSNFLHVLLASLCPSDPSPKFLLLPGSHAYPFLPGYWLFSTLVNQSEGALADEVKQTHIHSVQKDYPTTFLHFFLQLINCNWIYWYFSYYLWPHSPPVRAPPLRLWPGRSSDVASSSSAAAIAAVKRSF